MKKLTEVMFSVGIAASFGLIASADSAVIAAQNPNATNLANDQVSESILLSQGRVFCVVARIRTGQLAVRFTPGGESRAGLNNGDTVRLLDFQGNWAYIRIVDGPNPQLNGVEGWVNSDYLDCWRE